MTRTTTGLCIAAALGFAVSAGAQSPTSTTTDPSQRTASTTAGSNKDITVTGCLARGADGTFMLNNARTDDNMSSSHSSASSSPTTTTASPTTAGGSSTTTATGTTGTSGTSGVGTTAAEPSSHAAGATSWKLEGGKDLDRHVGHEIQVTGRSDMSASSTASAAAPTTTAPGATTTAGSRSSMNEPRLEVSSVKMISSTCR